MHSSLITDDTIVAIASPLAPARRGIVRMSGGQTVSILKGLGLLSPTDTSPAARRWTSTLDLPQPLGQIPIDVLVWPTNRSYTGQPSAEFHLIGSLPVVESVVNRLMDAGARPARPGEFTMRAFLAGRLDLTQAEAVLGVIDAEDSQTLDRALSQLAGNLSRPLQRARDILLNLLADVEAGLDFVDEDIEFIEDADLIDRLRELLEVLALASIQLQERSGPTSSLNVVLRGLPNAGKSCLLNALTQTDTAIVTDQAGTTRDVITVHVEHSGHFFTITDTAGIENRSPDNPDYEVMRQAQAKATEAVERADVCVWCVDGTDIMASSPLVGDPVKSRKRSVVDVVARTKADLGTAGMIRSDDDPVRDSARDDDLAGEPDRIDVSSITGQGLDALWDQLLAVAQRHDATETGGVIGTAARCRDSLHQAITSIETAIESTQTQVGHELVAAEMRSAVNHLGEVTGAVYTDDILDRVFSRFCIGK